MTQSPEIAGGAGFAFEDYVAAFFIAAMISENSAPALNDRVVKRVALQQKSFGEPLDDLIVDACSINGETARLSLQVKRSLVISDAASNYDFRKIVEDSWLTLKKENFRKDIDRYGGAIGTISDDKFRDLNRVCELARESSTAETFFPRFNENGNEGKTHLLIPKLGDFILKIKKNGKQPFFFSIYSFYKQYQKKKITKKRELGVKIHFLRYFIKSGRTATTEVKYFINLTNGTLILV